MHSHVIGIGSRDGGKSLHDHIKSVLAAPTAGKKGITLLQMRAHVAVMRMRGGIVRQRTDQCGNSRTHNIVSGAIFRVSFDIQAAFTPLTV